MLWKEIIAIITGYWTTLRVCRKIMKNYYFQECKIIGKCQEMTKCLLYMVWNGKKWKKILNKKAYFEKGKHTSRSEMYLLGFESCQHIAFHSFNKSSWQIFLPILWVLSSLCWLFPLLYKGFLAWCNLIFLFFIWLPVLLRS